MLNKAPALAKIRNGHWNRSASRYPAPIERSAYTDVTPTIPGRTHRASRLLNSQSAGGVSDAPLTPPIPSSALPVKPHRMPATYSEVRHFLSRKRATRASNQESRRPTNPHHVHAASGNKERKTKYERQHFRGSLDPYNVNHVVTIRNKNKVRGIRRG